MNLNISNKTAVFTIVSLNYCAFAKALMGSVSWSHPEWDRHVLLVDRCDDKHELGGELFTTLTIEELPLPKMREFLFRYGIMELNTAAKPWMFAYLRRLGYQRVIYLDPDILVVSRLIDVENLLDDGAAAVVTPHLTAPIDDGHHPTELDIMRAGAYNLGFLALAGMPAADAFIAWWQDKLEFGSVSEPDRGLFTDQKWVDLAPGMFGNFAILRDPGYNVAYWNLPHRRVTKQGDVWMAADRPMRFFHFSGFDPLNPKPFSKHQDRLNLDTIGAARDLALDYAGFLLENGYAQFRTRTYAFSAFEDGTPIPATIRALYREDPDVRYKAGENPFASSELFVLGEARGIPMILRGLWLQYSHLQRAFPDPLGWNREDFYRWFVEGGGAELEIPEAFVRPVSRTLSAMLNTAASKVKKAIRVSGKDSVWSRMLIFIHRKATGGKLGAARLMQYQKVTGPVEFMRIAFEQFRGSRWAKWFGLALPSGAGMDPLQAFVASVKQVEEVSDAASRWQTVRWQSARFHGINVVGYARSEHGLGQSLRSFVGALDAVAIPNVVIDFNKNNLSRIEDRSLEKRIVADPEYGVNVFHINADQMPEADMHFPAHLFARFNIGFWHWELPEMLEEHLAGFHRLNEVWVPTAFVQDAVSKRSPVPVVKIPHAIHFSVSAGARRARFGLPEDKFLFLMIYDFSSYQERKNPQAVLDAFDRAFMRDGSKAALVIKTQNAEFHKKDADALRDRLSGRADMVWINETLSRQEVYDLQAVCDALVSLHRSEGFGLGPAEAMFLGKPVIATNWSGNTEFMRPQNSLPVNYRLITIQKDIGVYRAGQIWADPDVEHAATLMRKIFDDEGLRERISLEAKRTMHEEFSPVVIGKKIRARLKYVQKVLISS